MTALGSADLKEAQRLLTLAETEYAVAGALEERQELLDAVSQRLGQAVVAENQARADEARRKSGVDSEKYAEAKEAGQRFVMKASAAYNKKEYASALAHVQAARDCYNAAGDDGKLAREEEPVVGNLYAVILQQQEMDARWAKLVRIKQLGDLVKLKKQADAFGIDFEEFQRVTGEGGESRA